ncbi:hypothetical protein BAE44_0004078 [Dichanthelium oligosanthes]|uniref:Uncharacterized protein n=1 Tax=Dichanthelium oligosanthes TaxID=888268 RepID=A0A1E5WBV3_9POAL|nr:hypothetical protein BAE44_0004078 [Dichanthelium oligosanthes]
MACCRVIFPEDEKTIDVRKVVMIARLLKNAVPKGEKCGSKYLIL